MARDISRDPGGAAGVAWRRAGGLGEPLVADGEILAVAKLMPGQVGDIHDAGALAEGKQHGKQLLFIEASAAVFRGEKVGLVGPNGAGKTTIFRMITGRGGARRGPGLASTRR
jgi:hypothetical protein